MMYVLHGLAGVGLITLIMTHVYFGLRSKKREITKSMIFGWMDRDFYLKEHDGRSKLPRHPSRPSGELHAAVERSILAPELVHRVEDLRRQGGRKRLTQVW